MPSKSPICIRPARPEDIPRLAALEAHIAPQPWTAQQLLGELNLSHALLLCALWEDQAVGYLDLHLVCQDGHINELGVDPHFRRRGVATALLERACAEAAAHGCAAVTLEVRARNEAARALYHACGFRELGVRPRLYSNPCDDGVILQKEL